MRLRAVSKPDATLHTPDIFKMAAQWIGFVVPNAPAPPHLPVQVQQSGKIGFALEQAVAHKSQVVVALLRAVRQKQVMA